jgi:hypothetical protein
VRRLQELNASNSNRFKDLHNNISMGDSAPPDYATVVIEAGRRGRQPHEDEEDDDDDIYLEPRDALSSFHQTRNGGPVPPPLVTSDVGAFSLDFGKLSTTL